MDDLCTITRTVKSLTVPIEGLRRLVTYLAPPEDEGGGFDDDFFFPSSLGVDTGLASFFFFSTLRYMKTKIHIDIIVTVQQLLPLIRFNL